MSVDVDVRDGASSFVEKWRARWPEWEFGMVFVPAAQRPLGEAWLSLLNELYEAAWGGGDPTPGLAKLAWWQEELGGWSKGARRHPLGALLQPRPAPWLQLGRALPDLRALRGDGVDDLVGPVTDAASIAGTQVPGGEAGRDFAAAVAACEAALFDGRTGDDSVAAVLQSVRDERVLMRGAAIEPATTARPGRPGCRLRGVQMALAAARLARPGVPVSPLRALLGAWRGARRAG